MFFNARFAGHEDELGLRRVPSNWMHGKDDRVGKMEQHSVVYSGTSCV